MLSLNICNYGYSFNGKVWRRNIKYTHTHTYIHARTHTYTHMLVNLHNKDISKKDKNDLKSIKIGKNSYIHYVVELWLVRFELKYSDNSEIEVPIKTEEANVFIEQNTLHSVRMNEWVNEWNLDWVKWDGLWLDLRSSIHLRNK